MGDLTAAQLDTNYQERARVARYALEDLQGLDDEWFVHDNKLLRHEIKRDGEGFLFLKSHFSGSEFEPSLVGYDMYVPQITDKGFKKVPIRLWVEHPKADAGINRTATMDALRQLIRDRNLVSGRVDIDVYYA